MTEFYIFEWSKGPVHTKGDRLCHEFRQYIFCDMLFFAYYIVGKYAISDVAIEHQ